MPHDTRWTTINTALTEYFRAHQRQQTVPSETLSPDGSGWGAASDDTSTDEPDDWLGSYRPMSSPGRIKLHFDRLLRFAISIAADLDRTAPLSPTQKEQIFVMASYVTYQHELFHHYCDLIRMMHGLPFTPAARLREEALAVAFSWHCLRRIPELSQGFLVPQKEQLIALMFNYRQPGYRDWVDFTEWHHILRSACEHMWGGAAGKLARNSFFLEPFLQVLFDDPGLTYGSVEVFGEPGIGMLTAALPQAPTLEPSMRVAQESAAQDAWLDKHVRAPWSRNGDGTIDVDGDLVLRDLDLRMLPVQFGRIRGSFDCADIGLAFVDGLPRQVDGDLICCGNRFTTLKGISEVVKEVGGRICFHDNPLASHVLGLAMIGGGQRVGLNHPMVRRIYAARDGELNDHIFAVQTDLIDQGLDAFAEL